MGAGLEKLGAGMQTYALEEKAKHDNLQVAQAQADFQIQNDKLFLEQQMNPDYRAAPQEFRSKALESSSEILNNITDPYLRERLRQQQRMNIESHGMRLDEHAITRYRTDVQEQDNSRLDDLAKLALQNPDPAVRTQKLQSAKSIIDAEVSAGIITAPQARTRYRQYVEKYGEAFVDDWISKDPKAVLDALDKIAPPAPAQRDETTAPKSKSSLQKMSLTPPGDTGLGGLDAHTGKNLFSSGRAERLGIKGGVGENLTEIATPSGASVKVNAQAAPHFQGFLQELEGMGYKIEDLGGYNPRMKRGSFTSMSEHAYGNAIDINPDKNPFRSAQTNLPPNVSQIAAKYGLIWGGDWTGRSKDPMHFEWAGPQQTAGAD